MRLNYNFAFKNSKLRPWQRPEPPNVLVSDAPINKKLKYIFKQYNKNSNLFYPPSLIIILIIGAHLFNLYPKRIIKNLENDHNKYAVVSSKLSNIEAGKKRIKRNIKDIDEYFYSHTNSYLFVHYLQNSVPEGVKLNYFYFSDNGFDINASSYDLESLNQFLTLIIESPVILKNSTKVDQLNRKDLNSSMKENIEINYEIQVYGQVNKLDKKTREDLYKESKATGLLRKLQRLNYLKSLLSS
tara:strand:+ start:85 stop:810 length:726 start_codon:yes stop_codon:yes gene_type:complete